MKICHDCVYYYREANIQLPLCLKKECNLDNARWLVNKSSDQTIACEDARRRSDLCGLDGTYFSRRPEE